uniref:Uncharacterized protein n=1 Tax=Fagus sylvatica TaxID=28930 RepID=A0A2N9IEY7_FAGSY
MHPGSWVNLQRVGKTLRAKAVVREKNASNLRLIFPCFLSVFARVFDLAPDVRFQRSWYLWKACATFFCEVLDLRETELGTERYGPANRGRQSVFGPSEGIFPAKIPARPGKVLAIREFHTVHERVLFSTCPGLRSTCYIAPDIGFRQSWRCRKACATYFLKVQALHRGKLGFARYDLANRGRWNVPYAKGSFSD